MAGLRRDVFFGEKWSGHSRLNNVCNKKEGSIEPPELALATYLNLLTTTKSALIFNVCPYETETEERINSNVRRMVISIHHGVISLIDIFASISLY